MNTTGRSTLPVWTICPNDLLDLVALAVAIDAANIYRHLWVLIGAGALGGQADE